MSEDRREHWLLWVDGVGGFLICVADLAVLGQAGADPAPDVPLLADISRRHACLRRDCEGFVLEAEKRVRVNGVEAERAVLRSGDRVTLGDSCQLRFELPLAGSTTARLSLVSGHRLACPADEVLLMSDTLIFGAKQAHVHVATLRSPIVLFRSGAGLSLRHAGRMTLDGKPAADRVELPFGAPLVLDELSLSLERWIA